MSTGKPHVHAALIKAWADGAKIQVYWRGEWVDITDPVWPHDSKYRIKPEPVYTAYYKRAVIQSNLNGEYFVLSVGQSGWGSVTRETCGKFVRWIDTEPQRELVSE